MAGATETPPPGPTILSGEYELVSLLGRGGMGVVYLAYQRTLKRKVAYKVLTHVALPDPDALARFGSEAKVLAKLQHPNIVQVFDSGACNGTPYLTMEYVAGGSLGKQLQERRPEPREAARLIATIARAVGHAHSQGIIHRDLNPANILLTAEGQPKVADFGLARDLDSVRLTSSGTVAGTLLYMAPEQFNSDKPQTPAVDVWALGIMLYEMVTGALPFAAGDPQQIISNVLNQEPVSLRSWQSNVPRDLETICLKCLRKDPHRRYSTANELAEDLERFLENRTILARPANPVEKCWRWCRRNPLAAGLTFGIALLLFAGSIFSLALANWAMREHDKAIGAAKAEAELRQQAEEAVKAEHKALAAEKEARASETKALAAERKAREEADAMTAMLESLLGSVRAGKDTLAELRRQMDTTAAQLKTNDRDPLLRARLLYTLAMTRRNLGDYNTSVELIEMSYSLRKRHLGEDHKITRETAHELAYTYIHVSRGEDALKILGPLLEIKQGKADGDGVETIRDLYLLCFAYGQTGRSDEQVAVYQRIVALCRKHYGESSAKTQWALANLTSIYRTRRQYELAIPILKTAYDCFRKNCTPTSTEMMWTRGELGSCLQESGQVEEALPYLRETYEFDVSLHGPSHHFTLRSAERLAKAYECTKKFAEAAPLRQSLRDQYQSINKKEAAEYHAKRLAEDLASAKK